MSESPLTPPEQNKRNWETFVRAVNIVKIAIFHPERLWPQLTTWTVVGPLVGIGIGSGIGVLSITPPLFLIAKMCFIASALIFWAKTVHWLVKSRTTRAERMILAFVMFGLSGMVLVEAVKWIQRNESKAVVVAQSPEQLQLTRIEFRADSGKPLYSLRIAATLNGSFSPEQLGHFGILVDFVDLHSDNFPEPNLWLGLQDAYGNSISEGKKSLVFGLSGFVRGRNPDIGGRTTLLRGETTDRIELDLELNRTPYHTLDDLNGKVVHVFITESLIDKIKAFTLVGNTYALIDTDTKESRAMKFPLPNSWPTEDRATWRYIVLGKPNAPIPMEGAWMFDFDRNIPRKVF